MDRDGWVKLKNDRDSWVIVPRKSTRTPKVEIQNKKTENEANNNDSSENEANKNDLSRSAEADENLREERKQKNILKKQRIKEEKKYKREQLARELRESKQRDTKVRVISQAAIDFSNKNVKNQKTNTTSVYQNPTNTYNALSNYSTDYPSLQAFNMHVKNKPASTVEKESKLNLKYNSSLPEGPIFKDISQTSVQNTTSSQKFLPSNKSSLFRSGSVTKVPENVPIKRKVRTKDLINLEIMDLIEHKMKSEAPKLKPQHQPVPVPQERIERRGKISEGKKKMTTLKKNQLRQKNHKTDLMAVLNEISLTNENLIKVEANVETESKDVQVIETSKEKEAKKSSKTSVGTSEEPLHVEAGSMKEPRNVDLRVPKEHHRVPKEHHRVDAELRKTKEQQDIINDLRTLMDPIHSRKFREYCTHVLSPEIDEMAKQMIELVVMFHQRLYHQDPIKAKMRRRFYCGLKEALKHMNKVTCLVLAPNLKPSPGNGCLDELVTKVLQAAAEQRVPVIFGLTDRLLGKLTFRKVPVSCISLINVQGAQEKFEKLKVLVSKATSRYNHLIQANILKNIYSFKRLDK